MVTTLLEMAEAGEGRPGLGESAHLVLTGVRQRFRLSARRPPARACVLFVAVVLGAFGAAGGTWLGWQTAASAPSDRDLRVDVDKGPAGGVPIPTRFVRYGAA
jgi:hypothetical protein